MEKVFTVVAVIFLLSTGAVAQKIKAGTYLSFPEQIGLLGNCKAQLTTERVVLTTDSKAPIQVF